jgi:hypothetical protein
MNKEMIVGNVGWVGGFLFSYFLFSTVLYFIFFHRESYLSAMLVTSGVLVFGEGIKKWLQ